MDILIKLKYIIFLILNLFVVQATAATVCASGCDATTIQAAFNNYDLAPGDIVEISDSRTYTESITWGSNDGGSSGNLVTLRAAAGQTPTIAGSIYVPNLQYIRIGQIQYGTLTVNPTSTGWIDGAINFSNTNYSVVENTTITDVYDGNGVMIQNGSHHNTIQNNTIYDIGTSYFASGGQGEGINVYRSGTYNIIQNNTLHDCAHGCIGIYGTLGSPNLTMGNQILNNYVYGGRGEGVSVLGSEYCLIDGNIIYNVGTVQTNLPKPAIQLSSNSRSSIRRNVIYNGHHYYAFEMSVYNSRNYNVDGNYLYNNTIHTWGTSVSSQGGGPVVYLGGMGGSLATVSGNKFYNNIFWNINLTGASGWYDGTHKLIFHASYSQMPAGSDWGASLSALAASGLGGHSIKNNVLRSNGGAGYASILGYSSVGGSYTYDNSLAHMQANFPTAITGNIESDPLFAGTPPATHWWYLQGGSPAIDAGIVVNDPYAAIGGWAQLTYNGAAPDIGVYESPSTTIILLPPTNIRIVN